MGTMGLPEFLSEEYDDLFQTLQTKVGPELGIEDPHD